MSSQALSNPAPTQPQSTLHYYQPGIVTPQEYFQLQQRRLREEQAREIARALAWCFIGAVLSLLLSLGTLLMLRPGAAFGH